MTGRWTYRVSAAGVLVLAAAAFTLSYDALHQLALDSRVRPALAWLWPVVIDGTIVVTLLTVLAAKRAATRAAYPWALFSLASVAFNIAHAPTGPSPSWCSRWLRSLWCSPPTCSCSRPPGGGRCPTRTVLWPHNRPTPNPHSRTGGATTAHPSRSAWIGAPRSALGPGSGQPTRPRSKPAKPQPVPAWPGPRA
jgi:hypothetical protein